jgi:hypothetical protein
MHRIFNIIACLALTAYCIYSLLMEIEDDMKWIIISGSLLVVSIIIDLLVKKEKLKRKETDSSYK